jgi:hypothetical protein
MSRAGAAVRRVAAAALLALALSLGLLVASLFRADGLGLVWASLAVDLVAVTLLVTALRRRRAR